ncbi:hypothetical protein TIFTF001_023808 [Ficus carica]|uniref:Uncharacterized protein n=1 Tax=Ficus carica TaxID=3494 RepID=A0AA88AV80_FICCA|nr:hypothetical protein TIFTF001_023808 [Ficus carica]
MVSEPNKLKRAAILQGRIKDLGPVIWPFAGLPVSVARKGIRHGLRHYARAIGGVGRGCFGAECKELIIVCRPQIRARPSRGLVDTTKAGLRGGGEGVGSVRGPALPVVGGVCPSRAIGFSSLLLAFFPRWSDRTASCSGVDRAEASPLVPRVGFCVNLSFVNQGIASAFAEWADFLRVVPLVCEL